MELSTLRAFITVADYKNITQASRALFISQPALSRKITDLERELGVLLLVRNNRSVELTPAGDVLYREGGALLDQVNQVVEKTQRASLVAEGTLAIGVTGPEQPYLRNLVRRYRAQYPQVEVRINHMGASALKQALKRGQVDLGFMLGFDASTLSDVEIRTLSRSTLCAVLPVDHPLATRPSVVFADLREETIVLLDEETSPVPYRHTLETFAANAFTPKKLSYVTGITDIFLHVEAGLGIGILLRAAEDMYGSPNVRFVDMEAEESDHDIVAVYNKTVINHALQSFLHVLQQEEKTAGQAKPEG